jgi:plastocyanin
MKTVIAVIVVLVVLGGGYALLKNNNDSSSGSMPNISNSKSSTSSSNVAVKPVATDTVSISDFAFASADITVKKGTTVNWTNNDTVGHTVTENDGKAGPKSDTLQKGDNYTFTYNEAGTFKYHCSIHPEMTGTVIVTE